jgi:hypothetical protein
MTQRILSITLNKKGDILWIHQAIINPVSHRLSLCVVTLLTKRCQASIRGNAIKYLARAYKKHESPIDDLKKARVYVDYLLQHELNLEDGYSKKHIHDFFRDQAQAR